MGSWRLYPSEQGGQWGTRGPPEPLASDGCEHPCLCGARSWPRSWPWAGSWGGAGPGMQHLLLPAAAGCRGRQEGREPQPHIPGEPGARAWQLGTGIACESRGGGREDGSPHRPPRHASPPGLPNNGREDSGRELGSAGGTAGHAPVACAWQAPSCWHLTPGCGPVPGPTAPCPTARCHPLPWPLSSPVLRGSRLALPSQSFCFPSLEGKGSEAQVSKVEKQFLPLQIAPVFICFLIPADSADTGWEAGAAVVAHWPPGPPRHPASTRAW